MKKTKNTLKRFNCEEILVVLSFWYVFLEYHLHQFSVPFVVEVNVVHQVADLDFLRDSDSVHLQAIQPRVSRSSPMQQKPSSPIYRRGRHGCTTLHMARITVLSITLYVLIGLRKTHLKIGSTGYANQQTGTKSPFSV